MTNRINPYRDIQTLQQTRAPRGPRPARQSPDSSAQTGTKADPSRILLSGPEQQMIDQYFPPSDAVSLRVYGPRNQTMPASAGALGTKLDLQG